MSAAMSEELRKVAAVTTLCHLCTMEQLEQWVVEARNPVKKKRRRKRVEIRPEA